MGRGTFSKGYFNKHQDLLVFEEGKKYDFTEKDPQGFTCLRRQSPGKENKSPEKQIPESQSLALAQSKPLSKKFFS